MNPETRIVAAIRRKLEAMGCLVLKIHGNAFQQAGWPDLLAIREGRAIWLEVKQPGQQATPLQAHRLRALRAAGCVACVVHDVDEVVDLLKIEGWNYETL